MATKSNKSKAQEKDSESLVHETILEGDGEMTIAQESSCVISDETVATTISEKDNTRQSENGKSKVVNSDNGKNETRHHDTPHGDWPIDRQKIKVIRERRTSFIVFLDTNEDVRWLVNDKRIAPLSDDARGAISRTRLLAATPVTYLDDVQKKAWNHMIGESLALALSGDVDDAISTIKKTQKFVLARAKETARIWFIEGSLSAFVPMLLFGIILYFIVRDFSDHSWFHVPLAQAIVFGSIGAQFSMLLRLSDLNVDPGAGKKAHHGEAFIRILLGVFAAVIAVVAVQADLIFGFIDHFENPISRFNTGAKLWWIPAVALLAGASERLIPTFLHQIETQALTNGLNATEADNSQQLANAEKKDDVDQQTVPLKDKQVINHTESR